MYKVGDMVVLAEPVEVFLKAATVGALSDPSPLSTKIGEGEECEVTSVTQGGALMLQWHPPFPDLVSRVFGKHPSSMVFVAAPSQVRYREATV